MDHSPQISTEDSPTAEHDAARELLRRLEAREANIGVVGLGYVGLPLAVEYARAGFDTVGIDRDMDRVDRLNTGENYIDDVDDEDLRRLTADGRLQGQTTFDPASEIDVFFVCVPTPVNDTKDPDLSHVESAIRSIADHLRLGQLIVLRSTTYPGTTEEEVLPLLQEAAEEQGLTLGRDYFLAYSPERADPGNETHTAGTIPIVVGGITDQGTAVAEQALRVFDADVHVVSTPKAAEMEKLLENIFRSVNIALVNELARLCDRIGDVSMWEVIDAAATKPFGFMPFYPGPGLGGHCIPIDPHYLSWIAQKYDFETSFITLAARVNESMPRYAVEAVVEAVAQQPVRLADAEVLILGAAYKENVSDTRNAPAGKIIELLRTKNVGTVCYHDPHVPSYEVNLQDGKTVDVPSVDLTLEVLQGCDVAVVVTDHDAFDHERIARHAPCIIDTRNALDEIEDADLRRKITLLGNRKRQTDRVDGSSASGAPRASRRNGPSGAGGS